MSMRYLMGVIAAAWQATGIDPIPVARRLCDDTRREEGRIEPEPMPQAAAADRAAKAGGEAVEPQVPV
jgi:hypothetical protein